MGSWTNINPLVSRHERWLSYLNFMLSLVKRDVRARYRRTVLGPLWAIIPPILTMVIFTFLRGVIGIDSQGVPYVVFAFSTIVPWTYFQKAISNIPVGLIANGALLRKMAIPRNIFPLVGLVTALFDFFMSFIVLLVILVLYQVPITWAWLWLPVLLLMLSLLAWVVGIGIASVSIYRRDILQGLPYIMQLWFFITPVVYSLDEIDSHLQLFYGLNPAVGLIDAFRQVLVFGRAPNGMLLLLGFLMTILGLLIAYPLYNVMSRYFADVL